MRYLFDGEEDGRQPFAFFLELQMRSWRGGDQHKRARYKYKKRIGQTSTHSTPPHPTHFQRRCVPDEKSGHVPPVQHTASGLIRDLIDEMTED